MPGPEGDHFVCFYPGVDQGIIPSPWLRGYSFAVRNLPPHGLPRLRAVVIAGEEPALRAADTINSKGGNAAATASMGDIVIQTTGGSVFSAGRD